MLNNKKKLVYIIVAIILIIAIATGVILLLNSSQKKTDADQAQSQAVSTKTTADSLKSQAIKVLSSDPAKAKTLLQQASQKYKDLNDTTNAIDVAQLLFQIDHTGTIK